MIANLILGLFTGAGGIGARLEGAYKARLAAQNETERLIADQNIRVLESEMEARREATAIRKQTSGFWEMRAAVGIVAIATALHYAAVILDSIYQFSWNVAALPDPMDKWQGQIILSFFGLQGVIGVASALIRRK